MIKESPEPRSNTDGLTICAIVGFAGVLAVAIPYSMQSAISYTKNALTQTICEALKNSGVFPDPPPDTMNDIRSAASACRLERSQIAAAVLRAAAEERTVKPSLLADAAAESIAMLQEIGHCEQPSRYEPPYTGCLQAAEILGLARNGEPVPRELLNNLLGELPVEEAEKTDLH